MEGEMQSRRNAIGLPLLFPHSTLLQQPYYTVQYSIACYAVRLVGEGRNGDPTSICTSFSTSTSTSMSACSTTF